MALPVSGSAFGIQARFPADRVRLVGRRGDYVRTSDSGDDRTFHFCPDCGAAVLFTGSDAPDLVRVPVGAFADPPSRRRPSPATSRDGIDGWQCLPQIEHEDY